MPDSRELYLVYSLYLLRPHLVWLHLLFVLPLCYSTYSTLTLLIKVSELKRELAMHDQLAQRSAVQYDPFTEAQQADVQQQVRHSRYSHSRYSHSRYSHSNAFVGTYRRCSYGCASLCRLGGMTLAAYHPSQVRAFLDDELEDLVPSSLRHAREIFAQFKALYREQAKRAAAAPPSYGGGGGGGRHGQSRQVAQLSASQQPDELEMQMPPVEVITGLGEQEFVGDLTAGDRSGGAPEGFSCGEARAILTMASLCLLRLPLAMASHVARSPARPSPQPYP